MARAKRLLTGFIAIASMVLALVTTTATTAQAESNGGVKVMPLGDSITDGITVPGAYRTDLWNKIVSNGYTVDFVGSQYNGPSNLGDHDHEGHSGWTIAQIDQNVVNWLRTYTPHTILLHIGTNDIYGSDPYGAPSRLATLLDHITSTAPDAEVFVAQITPLAFDDQIVRNYNGAIPGIVQNLANQGKHVHSVDMYSALTQSDLAFDGVHPNASGYSKMANVWWEGLQSVPGSIGDQSVAAAKSGV